MSPYCFVGILFLCLFVVLAYGWLGWADIESMSIPSLEWMTKRKRRRIMAIATLFWPVTLILSPLIVVCLLCKLAVFLFGIAFLDW